ncbi:MAG: helix-turn-helix domain-containing protein [Rhodospirillaceae bacterium]|nr:helix-turn-helix domain-containing protein [Rhodospirillaceae bacterium]MBT4043453.1 helix-turn-helix domain-containing protein [Rhodospirillaceae bacterium]MBT4688685.1 helix-turn-helix domain-containing protein [Rhodospirillaceae bacterium]MBT5080971.1 helix-turn-helix domain-containing protein [Rhodospirillaceae bacterium]MBT5523032.1 helix-turn-helix domain-containing protein [Rhodospirillaceae bacterium]
MPRGYCLRYGGICVRTVNTWGQRYREEGLAGLQDRSSGPHTIPNKTPNAIEAEVIALHRQRRIYQ